MLLAPWSNRERKFSSCYLTHCHITTLLFLLDFKERQKWNRDQQKHFNLFCCWKIHLSFWKFKKKMKAFELLKEADDMLNMYIAWMFANLIVLQKKVTIKTNDDDKLHFHNDVFYYTARVHTRIDSPGTLKFPLLSLSLNLATVFWSQRWWHTDKQQYRFIVKFANLIFLGSS